MPSHADTPVRPALSAAYRLDTTQAHLYHYQTTPACVGSGIWGKVPGIERTWQPVYLRTLLISCLAVNYYVTFEVDGESATRVVAGPLLRLNRTLLTYYHSTLYASSVSLTAALL